MFVRKLVSGVRSSWDASATSWRCARGRFLEGSEHGVEARREAAQLVPAVCVDPLGEVARVRDLLARLGEAPHRCERGSRDEEPERCGDPDPSGRDQEQEERDPIERVMDIRQRLCDLERVPTPVRVHRGNGEDADVGLADLRIAEEGSVAGLGRLQRSLS